MLKGLGVSFTALQRERETRKRKTFGETQQCALSVCVCVWQRVEEICRYIQLVVQRFQTGAPFKFRTKKMDRRQKFPTAFDFKFSNKSTNNKEIRALNPQDPKFFPLFLN